MTTETPKFIRRYKRDTGEISLKFEVSRSRTFFFELPDEVVAFDSDDSDRIEKELWDMDPKPDETQMCVPDGMGGLVSDTFSVTFTDDSREDWEIMLDIEEAVKRGLINRAFRA